MRPRLPSWMRSRKAMPRPVYRLASETTRRRFASSRWFLARSPSREIQSRSRRNGVASFSLSSSAIRSRSEEYRLFLGNGLALGRLAGLGGLLGRAGGRTVLGRVRAVGGLLRGLLGRRLLRTLRRGRRVDRFGVGGFGRVGADHGQLGRALGPGGGLGWTGLGALGASLGLVAHLDRGCLRGSGTGGRGDRGRPAGDRGGGTWFAGHA